MVKCNHLGPESSFSNLDYTFYRKGLIVEDAQNELEPYLISSCRLKVEEEWCWELVGDPCTVFLLMLLDPCIRLQTNDLYRHPLA